MQKNVWEDETTLGHVLFFIRHEKKKNEVEVMRCTPGAQGQLLHVPAQTPKLFRFKLVLSTTHILFDKYFAYI